MKNIHHRINRIRKSKFKINHKIIGNNQRSQTKKKTYIKRKDVDLQKGIAKMICYLLSTHSQHGGFLLLLLYP